MERRRGMHELGRAAGQAVGRTASRAGQRLKIFDDASPYVDKFGLLLLLTVGSVVALSLIGDDSGSDQEISIPAYVRAVVLTVVVGLTLVLALRASGVARRWFRLVDLIIGLIVLGTVGIIVLDLITGHADAANDPIREGIGPVVWLVLAMISPAVVVRRLVHQQAASRQTLLGTVCAFLLIPIAYYYLFIVVDTAQGGFFTETVDTTQPFMYFSLTTISTLGYGDLTARTDLARLFATSEAVVGQVFLVTFVALAVSRFASTWRPPAARSTDPDAAAEPTADAAGGTATETAVDAADAPAVDAAVVDEQHRGDDRPG